MYLRYGKAPSLKSRKSCANAECTELYRDGSHARLTVILAFRQYFSLSLPCSTYVANPPSSALTAIDVYTIWNECPKTILPYCRAVASGKGEAQH